MLKTIIDDFRAIKKNDPAAKNWLETFLCHTPWHALVLYRIAHWLHTALRLPVVPRFISVLARFWAGVEIHPGATIGRSFFIDHGTGVVIGETAEIGDNCVLFHGVTLGGTGHFRGKRHPTVGNNVLIGTQATLLGPINVGDNVQIGAETVIVNRDVPANTTVVGAPGVIVKREGRKVEEKLPPAHYLRQQPPSTGQQGEGI
ncbi:MAG TPA: serine O-acetyltransferase EpsC [Candidatus Glassbacteria bacterium]|nr:serine O-acetyltransferase EpsC [Candidatus Glassbacteria bacterium]